LLFRGEYAAQFQNEGSGGISARRFQDYATFLNSLDQGITQSRRQLERLQQELQRKRQDWVRMHAKTKALEEVMERDRKVSLGWKISANKEIATSATFVVRVPGNGHPVGKAHN
jgi:flagellar biosynthesis chaperone FliJ